MADDDFVDDFIKPFVKDKNLTEQHKIEAQNLLESELIEAQNLLESELIESQNLLDRDLITAENLVMQGRVDAENLMTSTLTESLNMVNNTVSHSEKLIHHVVEENKNLQAQASIEIENLRASAKVESENLKRLVASASENIRNIEKTELENSRNYVKTISENLKRTAVVRRENLKESAKVSAENLRRSAQISSANLKEIATVTATNLKRIAEKESENIKQTAGTITVNLMTRANVVISNISRIANNTSDKLRESSRIHSTNTVTDTYNSIHKMTNNLIIKDLKIKNKKQLISIAMVVSIVMGGGFFYLNQLPSSTMSQEGLSSNYLIQNLRGDTVDTWVSWKLPLDAQFHIHVLNSKYATKERLDAILDTIMSQQKIELDDSILHKGPKGTFSVYYDGWYGALNSITSDTKFNIPKNLHFHVDDDVATGNIEVELTDLSNPDGYSAYTKSIVDEVNHQILKSTITVYDIDKISLEDLRTLIRHELGHGFGLAHSTAPEDMMAPIISTDYPYISECDLDAITHLYDGGESSKVICEK